MTFILGRQNYENHEGYGCYRTASRMHEGTINPGETLRISQYITGYGKSEGLKIQAYISDQIFDKEKSYVTHSLTGSIAGEGKMDFSWGAEKSIISSHNFKLMLGGIKVDNAKHSYMFDIQEGATYTMTEQDAGDKAPFEYRLKTNANARPGSHYVSFYLTYFDGACWNCQEEKVTFTINNKFEEYNTILSWLAAAALIVTILHDGLYPVLVSAHDLGKLILSAR
jgi:hypothetical protein